MSRQMEQVPDLAFRVNGDGSIDIEQGFDPVAHVTLHACQVRLLFERAGHLLPPPPADELSKRLARHLCDILHDLADESGRSPWVDGVIDRLTALVSMLPDSLFQHDRDEAPTADRPDFQLTHPTKEK